ncbi:MAG: NAD(+) diphosphatase [Parasporobacterium sp.]|nr:NAD(+) diphosphatase [Parasporobacterium sp.]
MIQDIYPHRFYNEYRPNAAPSGESRILCYDSGKILVKKGPEGLIYPRLCELPEEGLNAVYAFCVDDTEYYLDISGNIFSADGFSYENVRDLRLFCDNVDGMITFTGDHLNQWYSQSRFCGRCSARTVPDTRERAMICPSCGHRIYPRLQPAVIVGVTDHDKLLVTQYRGGFKYYALVAGFAEIGETLEETVKREVMEETGLSVTNIRYYKSQPWGIAQDVLAGFFCDVEGDRQIRMDENELKLAQWRTRDEIELQPDSFSLTNEMMKVFKEGRMV